MENVTLTIKNYHRAKTVCMKDHPELGEWDWQFMGRETTPGNFESLALQGHNECVVSKFNLSNWEVTSWLYERNFEDLYDLGVRAYSGTSFYAEERSLSYIRDYESDLRADLAVLPEEWHEDYYAKYRDKVIDLFTKHSRCISSMITGPARFPTSRAEKANNAYDNAASDFVAWRESYRKRAEQRAKANQTPEERLSEEWKPLKKDIIRTAASIFAIDTENYPAHRSLFVSSIYGKLERIALNGKREILKLAMDLITELSNGMVEKGGKPIFTKRHKVWNLPEVCDTKIAKDEERANRDDVEIPFEGGKVVKCYSADRLQIFHDEKPSRDVIGNLKSRGFRWSPSNGCWQRQLNDNGYYAAAYILAGENSTFEERKIWIDIFRNAKSA